MNVFCIILYSVLPRKLLHLLNCFKSKRIKCLSVNNYVPPQTEILRVSKLSGLNNTETWQQLYTMD
jgi:hypothetical protein